jgi:2-C-methyl-D-erythritol 4-phosphate cytidylyltransferase
MMKNKTVTAVILIAGSSTRYGNTINKNFELLNDKPLFMISVNVFNSNKYIDNIIIVTKEDEKQKVESILKDYKTNKTINLVIGGNTRQESVYNSLINSLSDIVIIHDGARPLIKDEYIKKCLIEMDNYKGVSMGVKSKDTIKIADEFNEVIETTKRDNTWIIQTPQCFDRNILLNSHNKRKNKTNITDDCILLEKCGYKIKLIEGDYTNIKVTTKEDIKIIKEFIN